MPPDAEMRGARRRALMRAALGKPGSLNRWIAGTAIWLFAWLMVAIYVDWLARIAIFLFATLLAVAAFRARALAIGDEDEVRAAIRREKKLPLVPDEDEVRLDPELWLSRGSRLFEGVPPPPSAEDEGSGPRCLGTSTRVHH